MRLKNLPAKLAIALSITMLLGMQPVFAQDSNIVSENSGAIHPMGIYQWWGDLNDPNLSTLVEQGLAESPDAYIIQSLLDQANAQAGQNFAPLMPKVSLDFNGNVLPIDSYAGMIPPGQDRPDIYKTGSALLNASLTADIFGKQILSYKASRRDRDATRESNKSSAMTLSASIAQTYYQIVASKKQIKAIQEQIKANQNLLDLMQQYYERGDVSGLDVLQQRQQLAAIQTKLPSAKASMESSQKILATLLGMKSPYEGIEVGDNFPPVLTAPQTDQALSLIANNPELRSAEYQKRAAKNRKQSAAVSFLPTLQLSAYTGDQVVYVNELEEDWVWSVGAGISIPLFQGGQNLYNYRLARAQERQAAQTLRKAQLETKQQIETALIEEKSYQEQLVLYEKNLEAAKIAYEQSRSRYIAGVTTYQSLLTAMNSYQSAELNLIQAELANVNARIAVYQSLGGQWTQNNVETTEEINQ